MLVLSRKTNQEILINGNIKVTVLKVKGNVVRIGIEAPSDVGIKRGELQTQNDVSPAEKSPVDRTGVERSTVDGTAVDSDATFTVSIDAKAVEVSEEAAGFQLLPLPNQSTSPDARCAQSAFKIQSQFPEMIQRNRFCQPVNPNHKLD